MKIDRENGRLIFEAGSIAPRLDRQDFLATSFGRDSESFGANDGWVRLGFDPEPGVGVVAFFKDDRLKHIDICFSIPADARNELSMEGERLRKSRHDAWLRTELGEPPYEYPWGTVISEIDVKTGDSSIFVTYD